MKYDFRKNGIKLFIISIVVLILLKQVDISLNIRLFIGTFFIGTALFFIIFGKFNSLDDDDDE
jgi:uncharacterized membrane protein